MPIDMLVLDEWLSILEQIHAKLSRNSEAVIKRLIYLIQNAKHVVVMDGHLT